MLRRLAALALLFASAATAHAGALTEPWPDGPSVAAIHEVTVGFPSTSPFTPREIMRGDAAPTPAIAYFFAPPGTPAPGSVPAVVMLHGSGGVLHAREMTYGPQLAKLGIAVLVIDSFAARRERATAFVDRLIEITESMVLADAYAGLHWLAQRAEIDPKRIVLTGFSYGGMSTMYAMQAQIAEKLAPDGLRFAGHVAFYGPCIARFEDKRTTGAPLLMLYGGEDDLIDHERCDQVAGDLREGGSQVEITVYPHAVHQWDGGFERRLIGRQLAACRFWVEADGTIRHQALWLPLSTPFWRKIGLGLCTSGRPYPIGRDDAVRAQSNRDYGRFLERLLAP
jgi:dienelactone hydrolase